MSVAVAGDVYAFPLDTVSTVLKAPQIAGAASAEPAVLGLIEHDGAVVPLVSLAALLGLQRSTDGAFAVVLEGMVEPLAARITREVGLPTIGIGASPACDGQVLVTDDMLGMFERTPRFVKRYDDLAARIGEAVRTYADDVRSRSFPTADQIYRPKP